MADPAIHVGHQLGCTELGVSLGIDLGVGLGVGARLGLGMHVAVVPKMIETSDRCFMLAITRRHAPGQLERQQHSHKERDQGFHRDAIIAEGWGPPERPTGAALIPAR